MVLWRLQVSGVLLFLWERQGASTIVFLHEWTEIRCLLRSSVSDGDPVQQHERDSAVILSAGQRAPPGGRKAALPREPEGDGGDPPGRDEGVSSSRLYTQDKIENEKK